MTRHQLVIVNLSTLWLRVNNPADVLITMTVSRSGPHPRKMDASTAPGPFTHKPVIFAKTPAQERVDDVGEEHGRAPHPSHDGLMELNIL
ncbi:hypothetical protein Zmor_002451 [Zophobas morio]|uniref:Uncharacterized protein n=1 Tax=Zophobas morio TaxID=2755281 RepID=A0AA38MTU5_9CUCU|nr:hypothetical protein Zmor_002451 [Zophobas morio]